MDSDIAGWILEFIFRHQALDDRTLNSLVTVLPLPRDNFSLKKSLLLRRITSETADDTISDAVLDLLELTEELDHTEGLPSTESMKRAYCHVAVDLTVKALEDAAEYFETVKSVWRGRVARMGDCGLVSDELMTWMDEFEAAMWDRDARWRVQKKGRDIDAVGAVKAYVAEAWEGLGSAFLDDVAEMAADDRSMRDVLGLEHDKEASTTVEEKSGDVVGDGGKGNAGRM